MRDSKLCRGSLPPSCAHRSIPSEWRSPGDRRGQVRMLSSHAGRPGCECQLCVFLLRVRQQVRMVPHMGAPAAVLGPCRWLRPIVAVVGTWGVAGRCVSPVCTGVCILSACLTDIKLGRILGDCHLFPCKWAEALKHRLCPEMPFYLPAEGNPGAFESFIPPSR